MPAWPWAPLLPPPLPKQRFARAALLFAACVCAACGLVYELALVALGSYLVGGSITQTSLVVSIVLFSMGIGALAAKPLSRRPITSFAAVEFTLGVVGAFSVPALYMAYAWLDLYTPALLVAAVLVGGLIGAEIPLLMKLVQKIRAQDASEAVADLSAADYLGALIGGLAFPFLLLPIFGLVQGAIVTGVVNLLAGVAVSGFLFGPAISRMARNVIRAAAFGLVAFLLLGSSVVGRIEVSAQQALYDDPIVFSDRSQYQDIVMTESSFTGFGKQDLRLYLNGNLQFASVDEYRYHEALVHPAMDGPHGRVLILGGGDGLAAREVLRYPDVSNVTLVELDPEMLHLAKTDDRVTSVNQDSLNDPRVTTVTDDAFKWVREHDDQNFDVVIVDFPDPDSVDTSKLYSQEFYGLTSRLLNPNGRMVVQSGSPYFAADAYWSVKATIASAGLAVTPYHVDVPSFGDWGFVLAARQQAPSIGVDPMVAPELRSLDDQVLAAATVFPKDRRDRDVRISTLLDPSILEYQRKGWQQE